MWATLSRLTMGNLGGWYRERGSRGTCRAKAQNDESMKSRKVCLFPWDQRHDMSM